MFIFSPLFLSNFTDFFQNFSIVFNFMILQLKLIVKFFMILNFTTHFSFFLDDQTPFPRTDIGGNFFYHCDGQAVPKYSVNAALTFFTLLPTASA